MRITVYPVEGRTIREPLNQSQLTEAGMDVVSSSYWQRLALDGDVTIEPIEEEEE